MSTNRKQKWKDRQRRKKAFQERSLSVHSLAPGELDIQAEIDHIVACAQQSDQRCVMIGTLLLFSTQSRDAWLLEPKDNLALCLARDGEAQSVHVVDSEKQFAIGWNKFFEFSDAVFVTIDHETGRRVAIDGYPIATILDVFAQYERLSGGAE